MGIETTIIPLVRQVIYTTYASFPTMGLTVGDLAWDTDRKCLYRWNASAWESIGISSRHGNYADIGNPANYPESSLYQADDVNRLYMLRTGAWAQISIDEGLQSQNVVTGSRVIGTVYQNTTGKVMLCMVNVTRASSTVIEAYCDAANPPITLICTGKVESASGFVAFIVPVNYYYKTVGGGVTLVGWTEYY